MATFQITQILAYLNELIQRVKEYTGTGVALIDGETVANGQTDDEIIVAIDVSAVKAFYLVSDQPVTFETNSGSAADNTISLLAGVPYVWTEDSYDSFLLDTDVTSVFITNASGSTATIYLKALMDATP